MQMYPEWATSPENLTVLDYIKGLIRAHDQAGLTIARSHIATIQSMIEKEYGNEAVKMDKAVE